MVIDTLESPALEAVSSLMQARIIFLAVAALAVR